MPGSYNPIELEVTPGKVTSTLTASWSRSSNNAGFTSTFASNARQRRPQPATKGSIHIDNVVIGKIGRGKGQAPNPDGVTNVARDGTLSWTAGEFGQDAQRVPGDTLRM